LQVAEYMQKIDALEERFKQRSSDFQRMQGELKTIKHFRKVKANLEEDLISVMHNTNSHFILKIMHKNSRYITCCVFLVLLDERKNLYS